MEQRIRMLSDYDTGAWSVSELCRRYEVSRDTFHAWRARRASGAADWFVERSHAPLRCPHRTPAALAEEIVRLRRRFPHFGPRKLLARLQREAPEVRWPAASTIGDIVKAAGLVAPVKRRRRPIDQARSFVAAVAPNDEWSADFKGWFRTRNGRRIDPLTLTDGVTRFLIEVRVVPPTAAGVRPVFAQAFREHGLPKAIRCDNGPPFGSTGVGGLTRLSVWWLKLGIAPHFIRPASPQENGRHERMHRTLKEQTTHPAAATATEQQARFDAFRRHYNEERPHEALAQHPPADVYVASSRAMPETVEDPWYDADHQVRRVRPAGDIKWKGEHVFIGEAFAGELLGLEELETGDHVVRFCAHDIGLIDRRGLFRRFAPPRTGLREPAEQTANPNPDLSTIIPVQSVDHLPG
ncbi:integrase core domain-containing protein [Blastochloris sulfoviridis]|uniref:integrase core domain-containing protein n=1 Tax=Blastochloris sulfoviridis TaxID=50712 RepID=UPI001FE542F3|nr:integrase core domain-containing protein [Blastochloris sulfoviridis]